MKNGIFCIFVGLVAGNLAAAGISVGATVAPRTRLEVQSQPATLALTAANVANGYVDVPVAGILDVRLNHSAGYLVRASLGQGVVSGAHIQVFGRNLNVARGGGWIEMPGAASTRDRASARLFLASDARPGVYDWPLQFAVAPLHRAGASPGCSTCPTEQRRSK